MGIPEAVYAAADIEPAADIDELVRALLAMAVFLSEWIEYRPPEGR